MAFTVPPSFMTAIDNNGLIVPGARCYFYQAGTTTQKAVYSDYGLTTALSAPSGYITADPYGRFQAGYIADGEQIKFAIKSADGAVTFYTIDHVLAPAQTSASGVTRLYSTQNSNFALDATMNAGLVGIDTTLSDISVSAPGTTLGNGFWVTLQKVSSGGNQFTISHGGGTETIDGQNTYTVDTAFETVTLICKGALGWSVVGRTSVEPVGELPLLNAQTSAAYQLVLTDKGAKITMTNAGVNTVTIPAFATVPFPLLSRIEVTQGGAGQTAIVAAATVSTQSYSNYLKILGQYAGVILTKVAINTWLIEGSVAP